MLQVTPLDDVESLFPGTNSGSHFLGLLFQMIVMGSRYFVKQLPVNENVSDMKCSQKIMSFGQYIHMI